LNDLSEFKNLKVLQVSDPQFSAASRDKLRKALPTLRIYR